MFEYPFARTSFLREMMATYGGNSFAGLYWRCYRGIHTRLLDCSGTSTFLPRGVCASVCVFLCPSNSDCLMALLSSVYACLPACSINCRCQIPSLFLSVFVSICWLLWLLTCSEDIWLSCSAASSEVLSLSYRRGPVTVNGAALKNSKSNFPAFSSGNSPSCCFHIHLWTNHSFWWNVINLLMHCCYPQPPTSTEVFTSSHIKT